MITLTDKSKCCGCSACACICPVNCITIIEDEEGFEYPSTDTERCISCNKCNQVCPYTKIKYEPENKSVYIGWSKNNDFLLSSSSGGAFITIADYWLNSLNGVIYGAGYDEHFVVQHMRAENNRQVKNLQTSKYVQSSTKNIFKHIKEDLDKNIPVMFVGTPCQVKGLKQYLNTQYNNLLLVDLKCHGVPSPKLWRKYLIYQINTHKGKNIRSINFRNKDKGWHDYSMKFEFTDNSIYCKNHYLDKFITAFLDNRALRPCCYSCKFDNSFSDITLADAWGVEKFHRKLNNIIDKDKGVSLIGVNSKNGGKIVETIKSKDNFVLIKTEMQLFNPHTIEMPKSRNKFFKHLENMSEEKFFNKVCHISLKNKLYVCVRFLLKKIGIISIIRKLRI